MPAWAALTLAALFTVRRCDRALCFTLKLAVGTEPKNSRHVYPLWKHLGSRGPGIAAHHPRPTWAPYTVVSYPGLQRSAGSARAPPAPVSVWPWHFVPEESTKPPVHLFSRSCPCPAGTRCTLGWGCGWDPPRGDPDGQAVCFSGSVEGDRASPLSITSAAGGRRPQAREEPSPEPGLKGCHAAQPTETCSPVLE